LATAVPFAYPQRESASPLSLRSRHAGGGLRELDELVRDADARGFVLVQAAGSVLDALSRHVERRARVSGRALVKIDGLPTDDAWRELAVRLQVTAGDPLAAAQAILDRAGASLVVVREGAPTHWGRALSDELGRISASEATVKSLILVLIEAAPAVSTARLIEVEAEVSADEIHLWWEAVSRDAGRSIGAGLDRLDAIERWWSAARATPAEQPVPSVPLGPAAARLFGRLALSQRSWLVAQLGRLGPLAAAEELVRAGVVALDEQGRVVAGGVVSTDFAVDREDTLAVAAALDGLPDPWAAARASELYASAGAFDRAEAASVCAVSALTDAAARADFWQRWDRTLGAMPEAEALPRILRAAEVALRIGDVDRGLEFAGAALSRRGDSFAVLLTMGRANVARGDLPTATYWLGKAGERAADAAARASVDVELAEVRHMEGDLDGARRHAEAVLAGQASASTRLHARNVIGKLLLAGSAWREAEDHFAADACEAALAGDLSGELRARLNRSIALLSSGRLDDARSMLGAVLAEGEGRGELRAVAYALTNLATIAILKREYPEALLLSDRAFDVRRRLGDKVSLALLITNIAELRLLLGQVVEAEQALTFGRQACGPGMPGARASHFAYTSALIHLERGRTVEASAELRLAVGTARGSSNGARLGECHRLAARIALEDGDLAAAEAAIEQASDLAESPRERAWVAVLEAQRARAAGEAFEAAAGEALDLARAADDPELIREAHLLLHHAAAIEGNARAARSQLEAAIGVRDQIAGVLPEDMRRRFLARRDLAQLARLEAQPGRLSTVPPPPPGSEVFSAPSIAPSIPPPSRAPGACRAPEAQAPALRRMVGRTAAMATLASAIQKVGASDTTVLVHGESGTGKELVAEALHESSPRRSGPIVKVNCAALVETLLLSELFGHEKGSFTGAAARRRGRFEMAEGGTIFLDEIGDISPRTQVALLRVLQDRTFERVGGVTPIKANVRIVCATHRDLAAMVARGEFREDLYYRLRGVVLEVPALRQRLADLPIIASAILARIASERDTAPKRLSPAALEGLARHPWPGNVRELENAFRAAALFAEGDTLELEDFTGNVDSLRGLVTMGPQAALDPGGLAKRALDPGALRAPDLPPITLTSVGLATIEESEGGTDDASDAAAMSQPSKSAPSSVKRPGGSPTEVAYAMIRSGTSLSDLKRDIERECIARALSETGGNITRAAGLLGMKRPRLSQLVKQYGFGADAEAEDGE
jgi:DNA-binding NtrC family response regulator/tetratricopeptide (TPR) repeat protein